MPNGNPRPIVVIAGATGFVGSSLRRALAEDYRLIGLTRSSAQLEAHRDSAEIKWQRCDLFSLLELEAALVGVDYALYLVHSMLPSARLLQGDFADLDLIMADNFARAAQRAHVKQIVYLGGLIPTRYNLSKHLASRLEVEEALGSGKTPLTSLRASLIVGPGGSSLRIVVNLVRRLPVMLLPQWTRTQTQPIAIQDVVRAFQGCLGKEAFFGRNLDIGGPDVMTYRQMLEHTARALGRKRFFFNVPFFSAGLSKLWVTLLGGASRYLVGPLVDSLKHPMVAHANPLLEQLIPGAVTFQTALRNSLDARGRLRANPRDALRPGDDSAIRRARTVRSVQRLPLPPGHTAHSLAQEYYRWLPRLVRPFLKSESTPDGKLRLSFLRRRWLLIEFTYADYRSSENRQLFYITGGWLARARDNPKGRIEFREMLDRRCMLVAIHDFTPRLPWALYRHTQAIFHLWVMRRFGRYLEKLPTLPSYK